MRQEENFRIPHASGRFLPPGPLCFKNVLTTSTDCGGSTPRLLLRPWALPPDSLSRPSNGGWTRTSGVPRP